MLPIPAITCWSRSSGFQLTARGREASAELGRPRSVGDRVDAQLGQLGELDGDVLADRRRPSRRTCAGRRTTAPPAVARRGASTTWVCFGRGAPAALTQHLAAHPQVDHQRVAGSRADRAGTCRGGRSTVMVAAGEPVDQRLRRRAPHRALAADLDAFDPAADDECRAARAGRSRPRAAQASPTRRADEGVERFRGRLLLGQLLRPSLARPERVSGNEHRGREGA